MKTLLTVGLFVLILGLFTQAAAQSKNAPLDEQAKCDAQASKVYHKSREQDGQSDDDATGMNGYSSHFDPATNICYVWIRYGKLDKQTVTFADTVYDAFEGRMYASYLWFNPGKPAAEVEPTNCFVKPRQHDQVTCKTQEEFDGLVDKYFGIGR